MSNQNNQNQQKGQGQGGNKTPKQPPRRIPEISLNNKKITTQEDGFLIVLDLTVRDQFGVPFKDTLVSLKDGNDVIEKAKTDQHGHVVLDPLLGPSYVKQTVILGVFVDGYAESLAVKAMLGSLKEAAKPPTLEVLDANRIELDAFFLTDPRYTDVVHIDIRLIAREGEALKRKIKIIFPDLQTEYDADTDETGHKVWQVPFRVVPGQKHFIKVTADRIVKPTEVSIENIPEPPRVTFWWVMSRPLTIVAAILFILLSAWFTIDSLGSFIVLFAKTAEERLYASHSPWYDVPVVLLWFVSLIACVLSLIGWFVAIGRAVTRGQFARIKWIRSRRVKDSSQDSILENLSEDIRKIYKESKEKKPAPSAVSEISVAGQTATAVTAPVVTASAPTSSGFSMSRLIQAELFGEVITKVIFGIGEAFYKGLFQKI